MDARFYWTVPMSRKEILFMLGCQFFPIWVLKKRVVLECDIYMYGAKKIFTPVSNIVRLGTAPSAVAILKSTFVLDCWSATLFVSTPVWLRTVKHLPNVAWLGAAPLRVANHCNVNFKLVIQCKLLSINHFKFSFPI